MVKGCGLHGYSLFHFFFNRSSNIVLNRTFFALVSSFVCLMFPGFFYSRVVEDYTKCELRGGGSIIMRCIVVIVDCIHVRHVVHYKRIRTYHTMLLLFTVPV